MRPKAKDQSAYTASSLPARAGVGLKAEHYADILDTLPDIGWVEVHPENYMGDGGPPHHYLSKIRTHYPLSLHGVGLSLGSYGPLDLAHLSRLKALISRYEPASFSEHLAWSSHDDIFFNDLLPVPYTQETLDRVCCHIDQTQEALGRVMLLENPSTYVAFTEADFEETQFLGEIAQRTGCGLLLDVNNIYVSATNHGFDAGAYLSRFPLQHVGEIHLAGHASDTDDTDDTLLIDAHDRAVAPDVWALFEQAIKLCGPKPALIEWDNDIPSWATLFAEAQKAEAAMTGIPAQSKAAE